MTEEEYYNAHMDQIKEAVAFLDGVYTDPKVGLSTAMAACLIHAARSHCDECHNRVVVSLINFLSILGEHDIVQALTVLLPKDIHKEKQVPPHAN